MVSIATSITDTEDRHTSGAYSKRPLTLVRGEGSYVWDDEGNRYLDATSGQGVALLGHNHPNVVAAIRAQSETFITCPEIFYNDRRAELYDLLASLTPGDLDRFFLCNSGAEAIEGALKVARLLTERSGIVAAKRGFHGRTLGALALTWNPKYRKPFQSWQPDVTHVAYNSLEAAAEAITDDTAAIVIEALQGEGGVYPIDTDYLRSLRRLCDERGALLIIDEIQMGFGRTGRWFAYQHADILPDIITLGKGIGGGLPMGAICWRESLGTIPRGTHGSTFGGNPLACAASIATLRALMDENVPAYVHETGTWLLEELRKLNLQSVREIRGQGLIIGIELRSRVTPVLKALQERGILALPAGMNVLRLLPPLTITRDELAIIINAIQETLSD
jgi:LysW-gamma-L-lysine/LysW-L-ornithine aminotransferase